MFLILPKFGLTYFGPKLVFWDLAKTAKRIFSKIILNTGNELVDIMKIVTLPENSILGPNLLILVIA